MLLKRFPIAKITSLWGSASACTLTSVLTAAMSGVLSLLMLVSFCALFSLVARMGFSSDPWGFVSSAQAHTPSRSEAATALQPIDEHILVFTAQELNALSEGLPSRHRPLVGHPVGQYLLTAYSASGLKAIPMQIDERVPDQLSGDAGVFDGRDELLLAVRDLGTRLPLPAIQHQDVRGQPSVALLRQPLWAWLQKHSKSVFELRVPLENAHGMDIAYLWVLDAPVPARYQSLEDRVSYETQTHFAETDHFSLAATSDNPLVWQDVRFQGWPAFPGSFLDTLKIRLTATTLGNTSRITMTNKNVYAQVMRVNDGALRATVDVRAKMVLAGVSVMRWDIEMQFYPKSVLVRLHSRTSPWVSTLLSGAALSIAFDGLALKGARVSASGVPVEVGLVNGKRSAVEALLADTGFADDQKWWQLRQPNHLRLFAHLQVQQPVGTAVSMVFDDDARLKIGPERYAGQLPNIGFKVERLPLRVPLSLQLLMRMDASADVYPVTRFRRF